MRKAASPSNSASPDSVTATPPRPDPLAATETEQQLRSELAALRDDAAATVRALEAERVRSSSLEAALAQQGADASLGLVRSLLDPLHRLEQVISLEEVRCAGGESPLLPALRATSDRFAEALAEHGVTSFRPGPADRFDGEMHEVASLLSRHGAHRPNAAQQRRQQDHQPHPDHVVKECFAAGLVHASGLVLRKASVSLQPPPKAPAAGGAGNSSTADSAAASDAAAREPRVHVLSKEDTLQGLSLRYSVHPSAILRLNRLAGAHSLHSRSTLRIPPPADCSQSARSRAAPRGAPHGDGRRRWQGAEQPVAPRWPFSFLAALVPSWFGAPPAGRPLRRATDTQLASSDEELELAFPR